MQDYRGCDPLLQVTKRICVIEENTGSTV